VVVGFGGQTPLKLARSLVDAGVPLLGMDFDAIELAEDREKFGALLENLGLKSPAYGMAATVEQALSVAGTLGYPVLIRPSFVLGGRAMEIVNNPEELRHYIAEAARVSPGYPVLIDRFLEGAIELDVDVLSDGERVWIAGLMEQIEEAGVHSGDSACVMPPVSLSDAMVAQVETAVTGLVRAMGAVGLVNIQMAIRGHDLYVLEANPRASRTVPYISKAIGVPVAKLAAKILVGRTLDELLAPYWPYPSRAEGNTKLNAHMETDQRAPTSWPTRSSVKEVVLPFGRFPGSDVLLGPEMRSTGEVMSFAQGFPEAFAKAQTAAGNPLPTSGTVLVSLADPDKREGISLIAQLADLGFDVVATRGTARALQAMGVAAREVPKVGEGRPDCVDVIVQNKVSLVVNTPSPAPATPEAAMGSKVPVPASAEPRGLSLPWHSGRSSGYRIRVAALEHHVPYVTTMVALRATVAAVRFLRSNTMSVCRLGEVEDRV
jgi:carbamoyl-phosphate synthase large subunit